MVLWLSVQEEKVGRFWFVVNCLYILINGQSLSPAEIFFLWPSVWPWLDWPDCLGHVAYYVLVGWLLCLFVCKIESVRSEGAKKLQGWKKSFPFQIYTWFMGHKAVVKHIAVISKSFGFQPFLNMCRVGVQNHNSCGSKTYSRDYQTRGVIKWRNLQEA